MTLIESAQTRFGGVDGASSQGVSGKDEGVWLQAAETMRGTRTNDSAMTGPDRSVGSAMPGVLTMDLSDVRLEEVARLRVAIASSCYRVSAADLADRMIASVTGAWRVGNRSFD